MTPASSTTRIPGSTIKGLNCPNCGAALQIRGFEHTLTVVCPQCLSVLDAKDPNLQVLQKFEAKTRIVPLIPLGSRGLWRGTVYEVIGFQQRTTEAGGTLYSWGEYLLFNPYKGFRYFTEYSGHWNDVRTLRALPSPGFALSAKPHVQFAGISYTHFDTAQAATTYVLGEFPWQVRRGECVAAKDYIAPPKILSSESTPSETAWSIGEYVSGAEIWQAFKLPGAPPRPVGVYLNQPNPLVEQSKELWRLYRTFLLIALALLLAGYVFSRNEEVFRQSYHFKAGVQPEASFVTPVFELKGRPTNVEISTRTDLSNNWTYFNYALVNEETGQAYDFGREVSYYSGRDSDGNWTEGSSGDTATLPNVPAGRYYLRVEPEMAPNSSSVDYDIRVRRDVPRASWFWLVAILLLIPPLWTTFRRISFESQRWRESDYAPAGGGSD
jgi:Domain of unknown function (DUF4178)